MKKSKKRKLEKSGYCVKEAAALLGLESEEIKMLEKQKSEQRSDKPRSKTKPT